MKINSFTNMLNQRSEIVMQNAIKELSGGKLFIFHPTGEYFMKTKTKPIQVFKSKGQWYFRVRARNGEILCQSEGYKNKKDAYLSIEKIWSILTKHIHPDME